MHLAVASKSAEMVSLLLKYDIPITQSFTHKDTPLMSALRMNYSEIALILLSNLQHANSIAMQDVEGNNAFHLAAQVGNMKLIEIMLEKQPQQNQTLLCTKNSKGWTPSVCASFNGFLNLAAKLSIDQKFHTSIETYEAPQLSLNNQCMCSVQLKLKIDTIDSQVSTIANVSVVGNRKNLGNWRFDKSTTKMIHSASEWICELRLPIHSETQMRYVLEIQYSQQNKVTFAYSDVIKIFPTDFHNSLTLNHTNPKLSIEEDAPPTILRGEKSLFEIPQKTCEGLFLFFTRDSLKTFVDCSSGLKPAYLVFAAKYPAIVSKVVKLPIQKSMHVFFDGLQPRNATHSDLSIEISLFSSSGLILAIAVFNVDVRSSTSKDKLGWNEEKVVSNLQLVSVTPSSHQVTLNTNDAQSSFAELSFRFMFAKPSSIHNQTSHSFAVSTPIYVGHRGSGAQGASMLGLQKHHRVHIEENTIDSFVAASNLDVDFVEFDVQLTKDNVAIIYHDFWIKDDETQFKYAINNLTLRELNLIFDRKISSFGEANKSTRSRSNRQSATKDRGATRS